MLIIVDYLCLVCTVAKNIIKIIYCIYFDQGKDIGDSMRPIFQARQNKYTIGQGGVLIRGLLYPDMTPPIQPPLHLCPHTQPPPLTHPTRA